MVVKEIKFAKMRLLRKRGRDNNTLSEIRGGGLRKMLRKRTVQMPGGVHLLYPGNANRQIDNNREIRKNKYTDNKRGADYSLYGDRLIQQGVKIQ